MAFVKNAGRQYPLVAVQKIDYTGYTSGAAFNAVELPVGARLLGVNFYTDTAWNTGTSATITVSDGTATFINAQDIKSAGSETSTQTPFKPYPAGGQISVTVTDTGTAPTAGAGHLVVQYVVDGRANDVQT